MIGPRRIDVSGLLASTLNISNKDFLSDNSFFQRLMENHYLP
jgi:hypothetical protein